jgi:hypothetical protein
MVDVKISPITCAYAVSKFEKHKELKPTLLNLIDQQECDVSTDRTSHTDWFNQSTEVREYWKAVYPYMSNHIIEVLKDLDQKILPTITNHWFAQYVESEYHSWHNHPYTIWANVYYVELDPASPPTTLLDPYTGNLIIPNVEEGDVLTFPGHIFHTSPRNNSIKRKTIIAFNVGGKYEINEKNNENINSI